jgi:hypothetical protein
VRTLLVTAVLLSACSSADVDGSCEPGDPPPWLCVSPGSTGPVCTDTHVEPYCSAGVWTCPDPSAMQDREHVCQCFGGPMSTRHRCGCSDAGVIACMFDCGSTRCAVGYEYCAVTSSDVGGEPDSYAFAPLVSPCDELGCDCILPGSVSCEHDTGAVTAHYPGG